MSSLRRCTRTGCSVAAVRTLTYAYVDSTAVVGPLATFAEPHSFDLCERHAARLTVPRGWDVLRLEPEPATPGGPDDIEAIADAVRENRPGVAPEQVDGLRKGHLRVLRTSPTP